MNDIKVCLVQYPIIWENPLENRALMDKVLGQKSGNPDIIVLPEMWNTGFSMNPEKLYESMTGPSLEWMKQKSIELNSAICGSLIIKDDEHFYNRFVFVAPEGNVEYYDKRHCFGLAGETEHFTPGTERKIFTYKNWRICPQICYDLRFPVWSRNQDDYDLLIYSSQFPARRRNAWLNLLPARAIENISYVIGVNGVGTDGNHIVYSGDSGVWDYEGNLLGNLESNHSTLSVELNWEKLMAFRRAYPFLKDRDKFNIL